MADDLDIGVLRRFVEGDREAFELLYRRHHREVFGWILRIVRERSAAEDAVVETFWRAYRGRARFDVERSFGAWLRRIATNAAVDQLRRTPRSTSIDTLAEPVAPAAPEADVHRHIRQALHALSPKLRVVAVLALVDDQPLADIADALGVPLGTVKSRLFRASQALRAALTHLGIQP